MKNEVRRHEVEHSPEKKEIPDRHFTFITKDREGTIGMTEIVFGGKSPNVHFIYEFDHNKNDSEYVRSFNDDHYRGINHFLTTASNYQGGRDDRIFNIEPTEESEAAFKKLFNEKEDLIEQIEKTRMMDHSGKFLPLEIKPALRSYKKESRYEDYLGNEKVGSTTINYISWDVKGRFRSEEQQVGTIGIEYPDGNLSPREETDFERKFLKKIKEEGPPEDVIQAFETIKAEFFQHKDEIGLTKLENRLQEVKEELKSFSELQNINANIQLYDYNSPDYDYLSKFLGEEDSIFLKDESLKIGDDERLKKQIKINDKNQQKKREEEAKEQKKAEEYEKRIKAIEAEMELRDRAEQEERDRVLRESQELEYKKMRAKVEAELTPELKAQIEYDLQRLEVFLSILKTVPSNNPEILKMKKNVPSDSIEEMRIQYDDSRRGLDIIQEIKQKQRILDQFSDRKKVNVVFPHLKERAYKILDKWSNIQNVIDANEEAEMVLDDGFATKENLKQKVSERFLADPWGQEIENIVAEVVEEIIEEIDI